MSTQETPNSLVAQITLVSDVTLSPILLSKELHFSSTKQQALHETEQA